jgi:hypothetical protein
MPTTNPTTIKDHFLSLHQDAVTWKAQVLWSKATDPDEQAMAMDQLTEMVMCIGNETKRLQYIELVQKNLRIKNQLLKKQVKDLIADREAKKQQEIAKKKLEAKFSNAEDAGLAPGFNGNIYDALKYGIYELEGVYYTRGTKGADYPVTNFTMKILYHVNTGDETAYRMVAVKNVYGFETFINMNTDDFVSLGSFKKILARRGDYIFKGSDSDLSRLQEYLQKEEKSIKYVGTLGYHKRGSFWAWANGLVPVKQGDEKIDFIPVDEHGITEHDGKFYFIPACSKMYEDKDNQFLNEKKFIYRAAPDKVNFESWNKLFLGAYKEKAIAATLHYIGSIFRDIIMKRMQRYPLLNLFGPPQAGKGKMAESLMSMFGHRQDQIMLGGATTAVGFMRKFGQISNAYVWLDEFKNSLPFKVQESIKNIYDGIGYERGKMSNDLQTESTPILSSCILSGQELPTGEAALFTRIILLPFDDGKHRTEDQRGSFDELKDIENEGGLPFITSRVVQHRQIVEDKFEKEFKLLQYSLSRKLVNPVIDDRFIDNISMLLCFRKIFDKVFPFAFTYEEAEAYMTENIQHHQVLKQGNDDVSKFWQVVESMFYQDIIIEEKDFKLEDGYIFIRVQQVHPLYVKEMISRRDMNYLSKSTLEHYLKLDKTVYAGEPRKRFSDGSNTWTFQMKYSKLGIDLIKIKGDMMSIDQKENALAAKYKEMGIEDGTVAGKTAELPFTSGWVGDTGPGF